jgi:hypothetical protein
MAQPCTTLLSISPQVRQLREERGFALVTEHSLEKARTWFPAQYTLFLGHK